MALRDQRGFGWLVGLIIIICVAVFATVVLPHLLNGNDHAPPQNDCLNCDNVWDACRANCSKEDGNCIFVCDTRHNECIAKYCK